MKWDSFFIEVKGETIETIIQPDGAEQSDPRESQAEGDEVFTHKSHDLVPIYDCSSMLSIKYFSICMVETSTATVIESIANSFTLINGLQSSMCTAALPMSPYMFMTAMVPPRVVPRGVAPDDSFAELIFPGFDADSFIWKMSLFQIAEFCFSLTLGQMNGMPTVCTLYDLGASWGPSIASGSLWRLLFPMTLHANMMHLFFNIFFQLRIGFGMEKQFGKKKFILLYMLCGVIGNMISVAVDPFKLAVGASTAGFGLIGVWMAEIFLSWNVMGPNRDRTLVWILFMLSSVVMMSSVAANIDIFGHLGGALAGFLAAVLISNMPERHKPEWYGKARALCATGLGTIVVLSALKIFLLTPHVSTITQCPTLTQLLKGLVQRA
jgi:membrane associated rhomboid family serine protease